MFLLDLPLALIALWVFHIFLKAPMLAFLPDGFRRRLRTSVNDFAFWPSKRLSLIFASILVGIATHLVWDAFTHDTSWIYQNWAFLHTPVRLPTGDMRMYKLLEYGSSVFGLAVVAGWIWYWYRTAQPSADPAAAQPLSGAHRRTLVAILPALAVLCGILRTYHAGKFHVGIRGLVYFTTDVLISSMSFFLFGLLICGIVDQTLHRCHVPNRRS